MYYISTRFKPIALLIMGLFVVNTMFAQLGNYSYSDSWGKKGLSVLEQKSSSMTLNYSITDFSIGKLEVNGKQMHTVNLPSHFLPSNEGEPNLPGSGNYIAIPNGAQPEIEIVDMKWEIIKGVDVAPAPRIPLDTENAPLEYKKKDKVYSKNAFFPESPVTLSKRFNLRGINTVLVGVTPFQYNPVTKELKIIRDIKIQVNYKGGSNTYGESRLRSRWWDPMIKDLILNDEVLPTIDYTNRMKEFTQKDNEEYEYVIITPNAESYQAWADSIRVFRNMQGVKTGVVTLEEIGGNNVNVIQNYIANIYHSWSVAPAAILILGDYGSDANYNVISPIYNDYCASDNIYADIDGDHLPDIVLARITANNEEQLSVMVRKFINYEKNPPTDADFYNHPITALGWQTERWFQVCSEAVGGFWKNELGKNPVRINAVYDGNPNTDPWSTATNTETVVGYFGPTGVGYIPASPSELDGWTGGNASKVASAINNGSFMLQHRDHGSEDGWGEPDFNINSINNLTNTDLTYVFSINCLTGKYNYSQEVFAEKFHRHHNGDELLGALGVMAASEVSYSFVNDTYVWGMYDYMWPNFLPDYGGEFPEQRNILPAFASAYGKYFLQQSSWPYNPDNKEVTYHLFHHHGGAFLNVYSEVPQELAISHNDVMVSGVPSFAIEAEEGAFIALSIDGELIAAAESAGGIVDIPVEFQQPGTVIDVVATKQNYFRYHSQVLVIPPDGPYVIKKDFTINDATGNNNGLADYGETVTIDLEMKNVGNEAADAVEVSIATDNPYVTITDASETYGNIPADLSVIKEGAFGMTISDAIPNQEEVNIAITATDGTEEWNSYITIVVNAPKVRILDMEISETLGNGNGYFDAGESGELSIRFKNVGAAAAYDITSSLFSTSSYVTLTESENSFEELAPNDEVTATFTIEIDDDTPSGTGVALINTVMAGKYAATKEFAVKVGLIFENWESGDLSNYTWVNDQYHPWQIDENQVYEGQYSIKSGGAGDSQSTTLDLQYSSIGEDSISFYKKLSTEEGYDYFKFYIDGIIQGSWSGNVDWSREVFFVGPGEHVFSWVYEKDHSQSIGDDCAWIDYIVLPAMLSTTVYAGPDFESCVGSEVKLIASATLYDSVRWETSGSGMFTDGTSVNAIYIPSEEDYNNGSASLTLTVYGSNGETMSDDVLVSFVPAILFEMETEYAACKGEELVFTPMIENYTEIEWSTDGDGVFNVDNPLEVSYIPSENDVLNGVVTFDVNVQAVGLCDDLHQVITLTVNPKATAAISGELEVCEGEMFDITTVLSGVAPWDLTIKNLSTDEEFTFVAEEENFTASLLAVEGAYKIVSLADANGCPSEGEGVVNVVVDSLPEMPEIMTNIDTVDLVNGNSTLFEGEVSQYALNYNWTIDPAEAGTLTPDGMNVTVEWNQDYEGEITLSYIASNDCGERMSEKTLWLWNTVGFDENAGLTNLNVYPNPSEGVFRLELALKNKENTTISILNSLGEQIWVNAYADVQFINENIDISAFAKGSYILSIQSDNVNTYKKIIIK